MRVLRGWGMSSRSMHAFPPGYSTHSNGGRHVQPDSSSNRIAYAVGTPAGKHTFVDSSIGFIHRPCSSENPASGGPRRPLGEVMLLTQRRDILRAAFSAAVSLTLHTLLFLVVELSPLMRCESAGSAYVAMFVDITDLTPDDVIPVLASGNGAPMESAKERPIRDDWNRVSGTIPAGKASEQGSAATDAVPSGDGGETSLAEESIDTKPLAESSLVERPLRTDEAVFTTMQDGGSPAEDSPEIPLPDPREGSMEMPAGTGETQTWDGAPGGVSPVDDLGKTIWTEESVDVKPQVRNNPLAYPEMARRRRIEGRVTVKALIDTEGRVQTVKVLDAQPEGVFEESVLRSLPRWRFSPAMYRGQAVSVWATIPIVFALK
jgi:TonB family protein